MDPRISRGFSRLPVGEPWAEGHVLLGRKEALPFGTCDPGERGPIPGPADPRLCSPGMRKSPFLPSRVSSCCYKTYLRYTGATKRSGCFSPRRTDSSICLPMPPITTADRCCLPLGTRTAPISDGDLITVDTVRAVDPGQELLLL